jgi:hypothetical protein
MFPFIIIVSQLWQKLSPINYMITHRKVCERLCIQQKSAISKCWIIIETVYNISCISYCHIAKSLCPFPSLPTYMASGLRCIRSGVYSVLQSCMCMDSFILAMKGEESWSHWYLKIVLKASVNWPLFTRKLFV